MREAIVRLARELHGLQPDEVTDEIVKNYEEAFRIAGLMVPLPNREDAIMKARHVIAELDDTGVRTVMERSIDSYYYTTEQIQTKLRLEGEALKDEAAIHVAGLLAGIDVDPEGKDR